LERLRSALSLQRVQLGRKHARNLRFGSEGSAPLEA